jgi:hypothetical protein
VSIVASEQFKNKLRAALQAAATGKQLSDDRERDRQIAAADLAKSLQVTAKRIMDEVAAPIMRDTIECFGLRGEPQLSDVVGWPCFATISQMSAQGLTKCIMVSVRPEGGSIEVRNGVATASPGDVLKFTMGAQSQRYAHDVSLATVEKDLEARIGGDVVSEYTKT